MGLSLSWVMQCQVTIKKTVILTVTRFISGYVQCFWKHTVEVTCLCKQTECSLLKHTGREGTDFMLSRCFCVDGGLYLRLFSDLSVLVGTFVWLFTLLTWLTENSGEEQHSSHIHPAGETPDSTKPKISFLSFFFFLSRDSDGGVGLTNFWIFIGDVLESTTGFPPKKTLSWNRDNNNEIPKILRLMVCL